MATPEEDFARLQDRFDGTQRDAFAALSRIFASYGLSTLAPRIADFIREGYSGETIGLLLAETPEYKQRFAANEARRKAGLPVLSPAEYLATERSYRQIMHAAGLPPGFYDSSDDFRRFLEQDISPQEVQSRVTAASDFINNAPPEAKAAWSRWYSKGDMIAYALDPSRAEPLIERRFQAAEIGGQASTHGFDVDRDYAERIAATGINGQQAAQAFGTIQQNIGNDMKLAALSGTTLTARDEMDEMFLANAEVTLKRERLAGQEAARFGGSSAISGNSLGSSDSGQF